MFRQFFVGRCGMDELNKLLFGAAVLCFLVAIFLPPGNGVHFYLIRFAALFAVLGALRACSRNLQRRRQENDRILKLRYQFSNWKDGLTRKVEARTERLQQKQARRAQKKDYRFFDCPECHSTVRVPRGKGKIEITCPKCRHKFVKKS
jgi:ribosomal protein L37AE/L43A